LFVALALVAYRGALGPWLAGSLAVFTVTHELGHATMAKIYGARAEIALDMLAGYTSYEPSRPMTTRERATIAFAGPMAEIVPGLLALTALGVNPFDQDAIRASDAALAIWWAGPVLGLVNLLPLLPLDGGVIISTIAEGAMPGRGKRYTQIASIALTALITVGLLSRPGLRPVALFSGALLVFQLVHRSTTAAAAAAVVHSPGWAAIDALLERGEPAKAGQYGATLFRQGGHADVAVLVARAAARLGETTTAMAWLQAGAIAADEPAQVVRILEEHPDFSGIRDHAAFGALHLVLTS
jgi:Zn-dependent protease